MVIFDGTPSRISFQEVLWITFSDPDARIIKESPEGIVVRSKGLDGRKYDVFFAGENLEIDLENNEFKGKTNFVKIDPAKTEGQSTTVNLPTETSLNKLNNVVDKDGGKANAKNAKKLDSVLQPTDSPFPNIDYTGNGEDNTGQGITGNDVFRTKGGNDYVYASSGKTTFKAGSGKDTFDASLLNFALKINLNTGKASKADTGKTVARLKDVENVVGTNKADSIIGDAQGNELDGSGGDDTINGNGGRDKIKGGAGKDKLNGGKDKDTIEGGKGDDTLFGGNDGVRDTFVFDTKKGSKNGTDTIKDWEEGVDRINLKNGKKSEVTVTNKDGDTIIKYSEGKIVIEGQELNKNQIDFTFLDLG